MRLMLAGGGRASLVGAMGFLVSRPAVAARELAVALDCDEWNKCQRIIICDLSFTYLFPLILGEEGEAAMRMPGIVAKLHTCLKWCLLLGERGCPDLLLPSMALGARNDDPSPLLSRAPLGPYVDCHLNVGHASLSLSLCLCLVLVELVIVYMGRD